MSIILKRYQQLSGLPMGRRLFAKLVGLNAPFFRYLKASVVDLRPGYCETSMKNRWGVQNHLGTINAGALCSLAEMTGGMALDSAVPNDLRWIPRGMQVNYLQKATGHITAISEFASEIVEAGDVVIPVVVRNAQKQEVFSAEITFYLSPKPS